MKVNATVSDIINVLQQVEAKCGKDTPIIVNEIMGDLHPLFNIYLNNSEGNSEAQVLLEFDREDVHPTVDKKVNCFSDSGKFFVENQIQPTKVFIVTDDDTDVYFEPMGTEQFMQFCKSRLNDIDVSGVNTWAEDEWVNRLEEIIDNPNTMTLEEAKEVCNSLYFDVREIEVY